MSNDVGYIDPDAISTGSNPAFIRESNWRDIHKKESLKAKMLVLFAFGGKLPNADRKFSITYKSSRRFDIRMEGPNPDGSQDSWRGISREDNGQLDAEQIREKWWELVENAQEAAKVRKERKKKRQKTMDRREEKKEFIQEEFEIADVYAPKADQLLPQGVEIGGKEAHIDARGTDTHRIQIYGLSKTELLQLRDFVESEFST